ncbi:hypothetical protein MMC10_006537 [Thelotrema lepadinum]|nr:hypothetical protein [Thelotrema lepadinum]
MNATPQYPYSTFNTSATNYTGPVFGDIPYTHIWTHLSLLKKSCQDVIGTDANQWNVLVSECCMRNLNEQRKANLASYSYLLSLWPAFVALYASMGPDASYAAYDNILWATMLALTSGAMCGLQPVSVPHHLMAPSYNEALRICESARSGVKGHNTGRFSLQRRTPSRWLHINQWIFLVFCFALWAGFTGSFTWGLTQAFSYAGAPGVWNEEGSIWCYLACVPAAVQALCQLMFNNVEIYEPLGDRSSLQAEPGMRMTSPYHDSGPKCQSCSLGMNGIQVWKRIIANQIRARPYRLLVHPISETWKNDVYRYTIMIARFALLVVGSIQQGQFFLYPPDLVIIQTVILVFSTASPRALWPTFWVRDKRGADLIVFYSTPSETSIYR